MLALSNRHERLAQLVAGGGAAAVAYIAVYGAKAASAYAAASRLLRIVKVSARIAEIQRAAASNAVMSLQEKREFLALIVRTSIGKIDENSPLCQSYRRTTGRRASFSIQMPDKAQAIMLDAKLAGELPPKPAAVSATPPERGFVVTEVKRAEMIARKRESMERSLAARNGGPQIFGQLKANCPA